MEIFGVLIKIKCDKVHGKHVIIRIYGVQVTKRGRGKNVKHIFRHSNNFATY